MNSTTSPSLLLHLRSLPSTLHSSLFTLLFLLLQLPLLADSPTTLPTALHRTWTFPEDGVTFDSRFPASRLSDCTRTAPNEYLAITSPENTPINKSAWFAFKISSLAPREITVRLRCNDAPLRYRPKISIDGLSWLTLPPESFTPGKTEGILRLKIAPEPLYIAAQELLGVEHLEAWSRTLERLPFITRTQIGRSVLGHPLHKLEIGNPDAGNSIVILGRQHPPEVTGTLALMRFIETLASDTPLARSFRQEFKVLLVPLINPDGVAHGHWRHNFHGVDLNRDWGKFLQPETRAVADQILALQSKTRVFLHLDFHSTGKDVFYTQTDDEPTFPPGFTKAWIDALRQRFPGNRINRSPSPTGPNNPVTSMAWAHCTLGVPGITYEIGDNTDRPFLQQLATAAAEEMMTLLLAAKSSPTPQ